MNGVFVLAVSMAGFLLAAAGVWLLRRYLKRATRWYAPQPASCEWDEHPSAWGPRAGTPRSSQVRNAIPFHTRGSAQAQSVRNLMLNAPVRRTRGACGEQPLRTSGGSPRT